MENQEWRLLKELPDISIGGIGIQEDKDLVIFKVNDYNEGSYVYEIDFVKSKPDWFEKIEPKDYNVFERLIKARDKISNKRGDIKIFMTNNSVLRSELITSNNYPFNFTGYPEALNFINENRKDLIKFFNM